MSKCKGCQAEIIWIKTVNGKNMPCNAEALYDAGYRKEKEVAKEIYEQLQRHGTTYIKKWIINNYGIELERGNINAKD